MKKSVSTQSLVNSYPEWARVRSDDQSLGFQLLNVFGIEIERLEKEIFRSGKNMLLPVANLEEIDLLYKVNLPSTFSFAKDTTDPLKDVPKVPTATGTIGTTTYTINSVTPNTLEEFWYKQYPTRISLSNTTSGLSDTLISDVVENFPKEGSFKHHLTKGGFLYVEPGAAKQFIQVKNNDIISSKVILHGKTRKGTFDREELVFGWQYRAKTLKEWKEITKVETYNMPAGINITIKSSDFSNTDYESFWNLRYSSKSRRKIDEFWKLETTTNGVNVLSRQEYIYDDWRDLIVLGADKHTVKRWELLDSTLANITPVDLAIHPFREDDLVWITDGQKLYLYNMDEEMPSSVNALKDRTPGTHVRIDTDERYIILGEEIQFIPWHQRPLKELASYRLWYSDPDGIKYGLNKGSQVAYTSDYWIKGQQLKRTIEDLVIIPATKRGEYIVTLEAVYVDGEKHIEKTIFKTLDKRPLKEFDLTTLLAGDTLTGLEFDSDQLLWGKGASGTYYQFTLHYDHMLIDFDNKVIYFREKYDSVDITP